MGSSCSKLPQNSDSERQDFTSVVKQQSGTQSSVVSPEMIASRTTNSNSVSHRFPSSTSTSATTKNPFFAFRDRFDDGSMSNISGQAQKNSLRQPIRVRVEATRLRLSGENSEWLSRRASDHRPSVTVATPTSTPTTIPTPTELRQRLSRYSHQEQRARQRMPPYVPQQPATSFFRVLGAEVFESGWNSELPCDDAMDGSSP